MRRLAVALLSATLVLAVPHAAHAQDTAAPTDTEPSAAPDEPTQVEPAGFEPEPIQWRRCGQARLRELGLRCSSLEVPLDHADPTGPTIRLALSRLRHSSSAADYRGVMVTNPGGPGASGLATPAQISDLPRGAGRQWDWIGMDTRGVGASRPRLTCPDTPPYPRRLRSYEPDNRRDLRFWRNVLQGLSDGCATSPAVELLPHMRSEDIADDFDVLRRALGVDEMGFYGISHGTYLAQVYASRYPQHVQAMVLDSVVDGTSTPIERSRSRVLPLIETQQAFFDYMASRPRRYGFGKSRRSVARSYWFLESQLDRRPVRGFGASDLSDVVGQAAYDLQLWPVIATGMERLAYRKRPGLLKRVLRSSDTGADSAAWYYATYCTDGPFPRSFAEFRDSMPLRGIYPLLRWRTVWGITPCTNWPVAGEPIADLDFSGLDVPVLMLANSGDGVTPLDGAFRVKQAMSTASIAVALGSYEHVAAGQGVFCIDISVARYLRSGFVPARDDAYSFMERRCRVDAPQQRLRGR